MSRLPDLITTYFGLAPDADTAALAVVFADNAVVLDEEKEHRGIGAIRAWRVGTMARTPFTARPLSVVEEHGVLAVPTEVTGSFPGSPLTLVHRFTLRDGRVAALEIR
jgi:hypothetical protein